MAQDASPVGTEQSRFELTRYLEGRTEAWGVFEDRFGRLRRRFHVEMDGCWEGAEFRLDERFRYDTGDTELRTWHILPGTEGRFRARCDDCLGEAAGVSTSEGVRMSYKFRLKMGERSVIVDFDDRIYKVGETLALNRATMSKWGVRLGELSLVFQKAPQDARPDATHELTRTAD